MKQYESQAIPEYLSVRSIVAALTVRFATPTPVENPIGESHDFPELLYVREGVHSTFVGGSVYTLGAGEMMIYAPMNIHYGMGGGIAEGSILSFKADFGTLPSIYNRIIALNSEQRDMLDAIIAEGERCYVKRDFPSPVGGMLLREGISEYRVQKLKRDLELFLIEVYRSEGLLSGGAPMSKKERREAQFLSIVKYMREHLSEPLSVDDIAYSASMSISKLKLMFREYTGSGPINYFIDLKLDRAKELISSGLYNLTEVAEALGFSSLHYFSRLFKLRNGCSPSEWERKNTSK